MHTVSADCLRVCPTAPAHLSDMAAMTVTLDSAELKLVRGAHRQKSLTKDREAYNRHRDQHVKSAQKDCSTGSVPASYRLARPHRAARAAARSWLAKGAVRGDTDMPTVSIGHPDWHKPVVSRKGLHLEKRCDDSLHWDEVDSDVDTSAPEFSAEDTPSSVEGDALPEELSSEEEHLAQDRPNDTESQSHAHSANLVEDSQASCQENEGEKPQEDQLRNRRECILKGVATKLQERAREAERLAEEATARALEVEQKAAAQRKKEQKEEMAATLKLAKAMDQQRARKIHKQVEQDRRKDELRRNELEAIRSQAEEERSAIKQQAFSEVAAMKAKAKADARAARARTILAAKAEAQEKVLACAESAQVEAAALRAEAERVAEAIKAKAAEDAKELLLQAAEEQAQARTSATAVAESAERRENILKEVVTKLQRQAREAEQEAEDAKARVSEFERKATAQQQKEETAATLKLAKAMDQQRARKIHKQAEQGRRQDEMQRNVLEAIKAEAQEEKRVIKQQALSEAAAMKAKAKADARAARAQVIAAAKIEAHAQAQAEASSLRAEAEIEAETIKANAAAHAQELLRQAEAQCTQSHSTVELAVVEDAQGSELASSAEEEQQVAQNPVASESSTMSDVEEDWHVLSGSEVEDGDWDVIV